MAKTSDTFWITLGGHHGFAAGLFNFFAGALGEGVGLDGEGLGEVSVAQYFNRAAALGEARRAHGGRVDRLLGVGENLGDVGQVHRLVIDAGVVVEAALGDTPEERVLSAGEAELLAVARARARALVGLHGAQGGGFHRRVS